MYVINIPQWKIPDSLITIVYWLEAEDKVVNIYKLSKIKNN